MISLPLTIRYREQPQHTAVAWLIPGDDVSLWTTEWLRWKLLQAEWRVAVLPGWGVLTIVPAGQTPAVTPHAVPLGRVGSRWYLPLHAEVVPATTAEELEALLPRDYVAVVFHPTCGLLAIEQRELRGVQDLLAARPFVAQDWTAAEPGEALNDRVHSVQPGALPSLADVLQAGRDDIGSQSSQIEQLPPRPQEPANGLIARTGRGLAVSFFQALGGIARMLARALPKPGPQKPGTSSQPQRSPAAQPNFGMPGWLGSLANWAAKKVEGITQQIEAQRNKELKRLMHLLETNPDEGLKYALPFSSGGAHRGEATPGGSLVSRDVNFDLSRLGGGGPRSVWDMSPEYQLQLVHRYRALANRELQLGRHRRAAYIFAELLGDYEAAASALQAGEHWRDAAVLYRDRLNRPRAAAECLERGGLLHEAIAIFESLSEFEKVGDLFLRLEQPEDAKALWTTAAAVYEGKRDYLRAAKLVEEKIEQPEQAAAILDRSWLAGNQPRASLEKLFELFVRRQWHERSRERIKALRDSYNTDTVAIAGAEALTTVVRTYPDETITAFAADTARVMVGIHLKGADLAVRTRLVAALQELVPADRLLQRDGQRYLLTQETERAPKPPVVLPKKSPLKARSAEVVREFRDQRGTEWEAAVATGGRFYTVGNAHDWLEVMIWTWDFCGYHAPLKRRLPQGFVEPPQVAVDPQGHGPLLVATGFGKNEIPFYFVDKLSDHHGILFDHQVDFNFESARFQRAGLCYAHGRAYFIERDQATGYLVANGHLVGANHTLGEIVASFDLTYAEPDDSVLPTHGRSDLLVVGYQNELLLVRGADEIERLEFSGQIRQIVGSAPFTRTRLAVVTDNGVFVLWVQGREISQPIACALDLPDPVACFTLGGRLVVVSAAGGEVYETSGGKLTLHSTLPRFDERPLAVLPTDEPDQFAVVTRSALVRIYKI